MRWDRARYGVPVLVMAAIAGGALVPTLSGAASPPSLPAQSAQQLLADMAQAKVPALSGSLTWTANLGLSDLSTLENDLGGSSGDSGGSDSFSPLSLLSGSYQIDVWLGGPSAEHLALSETSDQEVDLVRNGDDVWLWNSTDESVTHLVLPAAPSPSTDSSAAAATPPLTPQQLAARLLQHLSPTTSVTTGAPLYVAGQPAYELLVAPGSAAGTTIDHIEVDVGANGALSGVPLQVVIYASGQSSPAAELGYTSINLGQPPANELTFTPPPGSTVATHDISGNGSGDHAEHGQGKLGLRTIGSGWTAVLTGTDQELGGALSNQEVDAVTSQVQVGGQQARLFSTDLLNVLIMPDGQFFAGFVTPTLLEADASSTS